MADLASYITTRAQLNQLLQLYEDKVDSHPVTEAPRGDALEQSLNKLVVSQRRAKTNSYVIGAIRQRFSILGKVNAQEARDIVYEASQPLYLVRNDPENQSRFRAMGALCSQCMDEAFAAVLSQDMPPPHRAGGGFSR